VSETVRTPWRPEVVAWAVLAALALAFVTVVLAADGARSLAGRVGGDFPAFYGAGTVVAEGDADELYDIRRQQRSQADLVADGEVQYFAYPPPVAAAYSLLARLPYLGAYVVHTTLMAAALVGAFWLVRPLLPEDRPHGSVIAAAALTFVPAFMAVTLGQNSALIVLLLAGSWRFSAEDRDVLAGLALGFLLFKPQYAVPIIGLHLLLGAWRTVAASVGVGIAWWVASAAMLGTGWVTDWLDQVGDFNAIDAEVNGANAISWLGMAERALGVGTLPARGAGIVLAASTALALAATWWRRDRSSLGLPMGLAAVGVLLTSPHAMFYDATLLLVSVAGLSAAGRAPRRWVLAAGWALGALHPLKDVVGLTPVSAVVVGSLVVVLAAVRRRRLVGPGIPHRANRATGPPSVA